MGILGWVGLIAVGVLWCAGGLAFNRICYSESGGSRGGGYIKGALCAAPV
nr:envelope glycoprotein L [Human alphaherpesvirus 1]